MSKANICPACVGYKSHKAKNCQACANAARALAERKTKNAEKTVDTQIGEVKINGPERRA